MANRRIPTARLTGSRTLRAASLLVPACLLVGAALAGGGGLRVSTTLEDFFQPGTQPETLTDDPLSAGICSTCHAGYSVNAPHDSWRTSLMAQSMRDPIFHAALAIAEQDAVASGDLCIRCHSPSGWVDGRSEPTDGSALFGNDYEGVTCSICHRMVDPVYEDMVSPSEDQAILNPANLGGMIPTNPHSGTYVLDPLDRRRGPYDLTGFVFHAWLESPFHQESLMCGTCHDVSNPVFDRVGGSTPAVTDTYVPNALDTAHPTQDKYDMFPVERTYSEWSQSAFAAGPVEMGGRFGGNITAVSSCQDCHMPDVTDQGCGLNPPVRSDMAPHYFAGANSWVLESILNLDQSHLLYGPAEESLLSQQEVDDAIARNIDMLGRAADLEGWREDDQLMVRVTNQTGHKLPTGYPEGRRMWLHVELFDEFDQLIDEFGHYDFVTATLTTNDTKVYETKLGLDSVMAAATGVPEGESFHFVLNNKIYKDNRIRRGASPTPASRRSRPPRSTPPTRTASTGTTRRTRSRATRRAPR